ncbi:uncharacterized protein [Spinacia oleracea]|uniref:Reverse transcriptase domain-containing protein n=1 Tax=Spinacia oleracea TaxID=3562 RepID=A0A9R0HR79_SPIOL|nr:uncharacterized protein LOC110775143 [Spinacia oleracea]
MMRSDDGSWASNPDEIKSMVVQYWYTLFTEEHPNYSVSNFSVGDFPMMSAREHESLCHPYAQCEVVRDIKSMQAFKSPRPDDFQLLIYLRYWDIMQPNVTKLVLDVVSGREFPDDFNRAFLVLNPKVESPEMVTQFRPIGLCNIVYKIATKIIVNRLKQVLPSLISPTQCSFVPHRQIIDNEIIVHEMLHTMRKKQGSMGYMALKIDFEKAYDRLRWSFLGIHSWNFDYLRV